MRFFSFFISPFNLLSIFSNTAGRASRVGVRGIFSPVRSTFSILKYGALGIAVMSLLEPALLAQYIPGWQTSYIGKTILVVAVLVVLASIARTISGVVKIMFWGAVAVVLFNQVLGTNSFKLPEVGKYADSTKLSKLSLPGVSDFKFPSLNLAGLFGGSANQKKSSAATAASSIDANGFSLLGNQNYDSAAGTGLETFGFLEGNKPRGAVQVKEGVAVRDGVKRIGQLSRGTGSKGILLPDFGFSSDDITKSASSVFSGYGDDIFFSKPYKANYGDSIGTGGSGQSGVSDILNGLDLNSLGINGGSLNKLQNFDFRQLSGEGLEALKGLGSNLSYEKIKQKAQELQGK